ncbi:MAG: hypothetical protein AUG49_09810 [Catenulispora sp. 13_1_20CM_3_70_7]|nr:MAG: hypothetical protein AUG49_09810 [Catenulispora sp. 13_1_20CM_3_70_7]
MSAATPPPPINALGPFDPGPDGTVAVDRRPSPALAPIDPLPAVAPAPGAVTVPKAPFVPQPAVTPSPLVLPTHPATELVDATTADATATLRAAGRLNTDGTPNLDANALQPQMPSAKFIDPAHPATLQDLIKALTSGNLPPPLPVDPLALLQALPDGIPRITYRVCSESDTKAASCSLTLPLIVPALVDVTGDHTPDVLVDMVPVAAPGDVIGAVTQLLDVQKQITDVQNTLNGILQILQDPLQAILHPELLVQKLQLEQTLRDLNTGLQDKLKALTDLIDLGVAVLEVRLPTSETTGKALHAHVWGVYDLPTHKRLSVGFDGFRRGDTLPVAALGLYTFNIGHFLQGIYDIHANLLQVGAGNAMAVTAGLGTVSDDANGAVVNPTVASARFSPVPLLFSAHAVIDPGSATSPETASVDATSTSSSHLDAQVLSDGASSDSFTQAKIDTVPTQVSAQVTRPQGTPNATVHYTASSTIDNVLFANFDYTGAQLSKATQAVAAKVPSAFDAALQATSTQAAGSDNVAFHYSASSALASLDADYYDRADGIVARGGLRQLPTAVDLVVDRPTSHLTLTTSGTIGQATLNASRDLGAYAPIDGDHATLVTSGTGVGISAQVSGLQSVDAYYDSHPRLTAKFNPGGQAFEAAANLDGDQKARADISNLPPSLSVDADTASGKIAYRAGAVVHRVQVAYTKVSAGPTLFAAVNELPQSVDVTYTLGDKPEVTYQASSAVPRVEVFASKEHIETLRPDADHYISALLTGLPTKIDYALDIPNRHLEGTSDQPFGGVDVVARLPIGGRDWTGDGKLTGIPAHFDADFNAGTMRFRGISGPLGSAAFTVTNHAGAVEPTGLHLAAHYRQSTDDLDGSVGVRNLTSVEYAHTPSDQTFTLQMDTGSDPVYVDADVLLGADDTRLAATGRVTDLPTKLTVTSSNGKLTYSADKHIGIELEVRLGKVAAINATAVPLFPNGVSAMAAACSGGAGCASDNSPFCTVFAGHCFGLTAILNLPGLPTSVTVDTQARTVAVTGYAPPTSALQAYVRLAGLIDSLPDIRALATLSGLPSPVDFTVGPMNFNGSSVDAKYTASAPLGSLTLDGQATTTNAQFPELRARATAGKLPAGFHVSGQFGSSTVVHVDDSAPVDAIGITVTSPTTGYLDGSVTGVPATADVTADLAGQHIEANMSAPISGVHLLAHVPYQGRTWSAYLNVLGIPGKFDADYAGGSFRFRGLSGPLRQAAAAITNNGGATAPSGPHLAVHYRQSTGDLDASAQINDLSSVSYSNASPGQTFALAMGAAHVALDGDVVLAAGGQDDTRLAVAGFIDTPNTLTVTVTGAKLTYQTDHPVGLLLEAHVGKVAALSQISGAPLYQQGAAVRARSCTTGGGCAQDNSPFCTVFAACFGAVATVSLPGVPTGITVDLPAGVVTVNGYQPGGVPLRAFVQLDGLIATVSHLAGYVEFKNLPSPLDLTAGPFTFDQAATSKLHLHYSASGPVGSLVAEAEAATNTQFGTLRGELTATDLPQTFDVSGEFGTNSTLTVRNSAPITGLTAEVTGTYGGQRASALATLSDVPQSVDLAVKGTDSSGTAIKVPIVTADSSAAGLDGSVQVDALLALKDFPGQVHEIFAGFTDLGTHIAEQTTHNATFDTYETTLTSTPEKTGSLVLGGSISIQAPKRIDIPDIKQKVECAGVTLLGFHTDGYVAVPSVDIQQTYVEADGFTRVHLVPATSYLAIGVEGEYDGFSVVFPKIKAVLDAHIHVVAKKFNNDVLPALYDHTIDLSPDNPATSIVSHVYDMTEREVGVFEIQVFGVGVGTYHVTHTPGLVGRFIPPANSGLAGAMVLPPQNDTGTRQFIFSLLDPNLSPEDAQLLDIAVSFGLSPFPASGGGASGPCS